MANRQCRKCGEYIPYTKKINGKSRNLQHRKFCLNCSPFGSHNTKKDDPSRRSFRSNPYKQWTDEQKLLHTARVYKRGLERKAKLIKMAGGKCIKCGYSKCQRALTFHHRDPSTKCFGLSLNTLWSTSWKKILDEFNKCDLLCVRCHAELEDEIAPVTERSYKKIIEKGLSL